MQRTFTRKILEYRDFHFLTIFSVIYYHCVHVYKVRYGKVHKNKVLGNKRYLTDIIRYLMYLSLNTRVRERYPPGSPKAFYSTLPG